MQTPFLRRFLPLLLTTVLAVATGAAWAQGRGPDRGDRGDRGGPPRAHVRSEAHRALSDSVRRIERQTGGQVLSAERVPYDGRDVNRVKIVDSSGRVRIYMDDPQARSRADGERTRDDDD